MLSFLKQNVSLFLGGGDSLCQLLGDDVRGRWTAEVRVVSEDARHAVECCKVKITVCAFFKRMWIADSKVRFLAEFECYRLKILVN